MRWKLHQAILCEVSLLDVEYDLGLNVLKRMLSRGFDEFSCDEIECMAYNVNLNFVLKLFEKYSTLERVSIWSNSRKITLSGKAKDKIFELIENDRIRIYHIPDNITAVHAKIYRFKKNSAVKFLAVGSPNFSEQSNKNLESLIYIVDDPVCSEIWTKIPALFTELNVDPQEGIPVHLSKAELVRPTIDQKYLEGLWKHQIEVLEWLVSRRFSIVNLPPGTGKTEIAFRYLRYLFERDKSLTAVVLVPTLVLLRQWMTLLSKVGIYNVEWGTDLSNLGKYFADPGHKVLVTLYSRFFDQYETYENRVKILNPNLLLILDECHNTYGHLEELAEFKSIVESFGSQFFISGLSATLDSFRFWDVNDFIGLMGGPNAQFEISLLRFYSYWNDLNPNPVLKPIRYTPIKYSLSSSEMEQYKRYTRSVAIELGRAPIVGSRDHSAAIRRASWLRSLQGGVRLLEQFIVTHLDRFARKSTIIFVQTNEIAENLRDFITGRPGWNPKASIYVYDSYRDEEYRSYALAQFKKHIGFCLISERMLSEGFDLPKVDTIVLHGSRKSKRDWIQKIGRAIRFDPEEPNSVAEIVDIVFCDTRGNPLSLEKERYETLTAISQ